MMLVQQLPQIAIMFTNKLGKELDSVLLLKALTTLLQQNSTIKVKVNWHPIYYDACSAVLQIAIMLTDKLGKELDSVLLEALTTLLQQNTKVKGQPASNLL